MKRNTHGSRYFCGNEISEYGQEMGYLDYRTFAKAFDAVMVNDITKLFYTDINGKFSEPEQINGYIDNIDEIEELEEKLCDLIDNDGPTEEIEEIKNKIEELKEEQDNPPEIFQYFIVSGYGAELIQEYTNDPLYYLDVIDCYIWGVTHWGTSWDYVLTDVKLEVE